MDRRFLTHRQIIHVHNRSHVRLSTESLDDIYTLTNSLNFFLLLPERKRLLRRYFWFQTCDKKEVNKTTADSEFICL